MEDKLKGLARRKEEVEILILNPPPKNNAKTLRSSLLDQHSNVLGN